MAADRAPCGCPFDALEASASRGGSRGFDHGVESFPIRDRPVTAEADDKKASAAVRAAARQALP